MRYAVPSGVPTASVNQAVRSSAGCDRMSDDPVDEDILTEGPPERGSRALLDYYWAVSAHFRLLNFLIDTVLKGDYAGRVAREALEGTEDYKEVSPSELAATDPGPRTLALRQSRQELVEMFLTRLVDNFQVFVVDIIRAVLHEKPEILKSRQQQVSVEYVLEFDSVEDLVQDLIEGKVNNLAYEGFRDLQEWCDGKGIPLLVPDDETAQIESLIALRNLIVHNRCIVDAKYLRTVGSSELEIGDRVEFDLDPVLEGLDLLNTIVNTTDAAVCGKFGVERVEVSRLLQERFDARFSPPEAVTESDSTELSPGVSDSE